MKRILTIVFLAATNYFAPLNGQVKNSYDFLKECFQYPPDNARPKVYWWWLNGRTDQSRITAEIKAMKDAGISGFDIFEIGVPSSDSTIKPGPPFLSDESLQAIKLAIDEAAKAGMEVGLNMASSWNAGGAWIKPEHAAKSIYYSKLKVSGNAPRNIKLPFPEIKLQKGAKRPVIQSTSDMIRPEWYRDVAIIAVPADANKQKTDTSEILDLTDYFNTGQEFLQWSVPSGEWNIYRFVCSNSGEQLKLPSKYSAGPIIDHFDSTATKTHFLYVLGRLKTVLNDFTGSALKSLYLASYEVTGNVWTPDLPNEFEKLNGYRLSKFLPSFFDPELYKPESLENFRKDFRKVLSQLMIKNFYGKAKQIANRYGLKINSEAGGPGLPLHNVPVEPLESLGSLDLPRGEFWISHSFFNEKGIDILRVVKEVSAASHIYGRGIVEEESFSSFQHWQEGPSDMKPFGDRAFCEGMNRVVIHGFSHNPEGTGFPGIVYHAGTHFNDKRIWWPKIRPFTDYLARLSSLFQVSDFFADVLYFYGDDIPNYTGPKNSRFSAGPGYDYEVINTDILKKLTVRDGRIELPGGTQFSIMAYDKHNLRDPELKQKIIALKKQGAIITETSAAAALSKLGLPPDFDYIDRDLYTLDYIHYIREETDLYFLRNTTDKWISRNCSFRQQDKVPEYWDPVTGEISPVQIYEQTEKHITLPVTLAPFGSCVIVFKKALEPAHFKRVFVPEKYPPMLFYTRRGTYISDDGLFMLTDGKGTTKIMNNTKVQNLGGAWEVSFQQERGAPAKTIFPELISWTKSDNPGIKYYSGTVVYEKTFQYDPVQNPEKEYTVFLDLGTLSKVGEVWLNGVSMGISWCLPYRFDVTDFLKPGNNLLRIEVANTWSNRLTGDAIRGEKYTITNIRTTNIYGLNNIQVPWSEVPLIPSGLTGPVNLIFIKPLGIR